MKDSLFSELLQSCQEMKILLGASLIGKAAGSNPANVGSSPTPPANNTSAWPHYLAQNQGKPKQADFYIDDATGRQVSEEWWPGDEHEGH